MELEAHILNFLRIDGVRVEEQLQLHHLQQLMHWFQSHQPPIEEHPADEFVHPSHRHQYRKPGLLTLQEFKDTLAIVLNTRSFDNQLDNLFAKLDTSSDGFVDWNEFCTYMLLQFRENDYMRTKQQIPFQTEAKMRHIIQNKQETTTKIVAVEGPTKFVTFGKDGALCVWSQSLHFEKCYKLCDSDEEQRGATKRRVKEWVTDAVYMPNCHKLAVASTGRDIRFYDTTTASQYIEEYCLFGFPDVPSCLDYWHETLEAGGKSSLFYGDDHGNIHVLHFTRVHIQMFSTPFKKDEGVRKIYFPDIQAYDDLDFVSYARLEFSHTYAIKKIVYMPDNDCVAVCTSCSRGSLVIADVQNKRKTYSFSITKGVDCFDYNKNLNSLVTGSADHVVRMWNPYVTSRPVAILQGHSMAVIDVKIQEDLNEIFSFSRDAVLRIWDMKEQICIQTVLLKFPSGFLGRLPEFGPFPMHLQQNPKVLLVAANDYVAMLKLGPSAPTTSKTPVTHSTQLCSAIYNPRFKQVVTAADDSTVALWDLETGAKSMLFANAHGNEEITCLAMDDSGRRLMTGARNGTIKIWNVQNGHNLHQLEAVEESEVTGIIQVIERKIIMAVGWNRKIVQYDDSQSDTVFIKADTSWKGGHIHTEDILSAALCPPNLLATASFDGEICVWFIETESLFKKLRKSQPIRTSARVSAITSNAYESNPDGNAPGQPDGARDQSANNSRSNSRVNSRPNSRHRKNHKPPHGQAAPVDKLLFLLERAKSKLPDVAILISSEAGTLRWWNVFGKKHEMGYFYAADQMDESVLGMCTDRTNAVLVTGDTVGKIAVWDITKYCTGPSAHKTRSSPDVRSSWTGHTQAVVSVELAELNSAIYVVSASADTTAKLWTLDGAPIGTFGQSEPWTLHPKSSPDEKMVNDVKERTDPTSTRSLDKSGETEKEGDKDTTLSNKDENVLTTQNGKTEGLPDNLKTKQPSASGKENLLNSEDPSQPPSNDAQQTTKVGLGSRVVEQLARVKQDRQDRREHFADIDYTVTNRRGTLQCCAYRAIELPPLMDVRVSDNLPDTSDYLSRTYNGLQDSGGGTNTNGDRPRQRKRSLIQSRFQLPSLSRNNSSMSSHGQQGTSVSTRRYSRGSVSCRPIVELPTQVE